MRLTGWTLLGPWRGELAVYNLAIQPLLPF